MRLAFLWFCVAAAALTAILWLVPTEDGSIRNVWLMDERDRMNLHGWWDNTFYHLRSFPQGKLIVPHCPLLGADWMLIKGVQDRLSIGYRPFVKAVGTTRHYWKFGAFRAYNRYFEADNTCAPRLGLTIEFPIWFVFLAFLAYPAMAFLRGPVRRWRRRSRPLAVGFCAKCSYNLTGNTSGVCPECGTPI